MIITIDGPTASGKSSLAHYIAQRLGLFHLNSGLLFRALAYCLMTYEDYTVEKIMHPQDEDILHVLQDIRYDFIHQKARVTYKECDITPFLKSPLMDQMASLLSTHLFVREQLLHFQRAYAKNHSVVVDGRDAGSIVFPEASCKIFLTASPAARAERWLAANRARGRTYTHERALDEIKTRDERDATRTVAPLVIPHDAIVIDNTGLDIEETYNHFCALYKMCTAS